jgi:hypothetical protein
MKSIDSAVTVEELRNILKDVSNLCRTVVFILLLAEKH